jgi:hypothetical protein
LLSFASLSSLFLQPSPPSWLLSFLFSPFQYHLIGQQLIDGYAPSSADFSGRSPNSVNMKDCNMNDCDMNDCLYGRINEKLW